jgi:hypothetical protein
MESVGPQGLGSRAQESSQGRWSWMGGSRGPSRAQEMERAAWGRMGGSRGPSRAQERAKRRLEGGGGAWKRMGGSRGPSRAQEMAERRLEVGGAAWRRMGGSRGLQGRLFGGPHGTGGIPSARARRRDAGGQSGRCSVVLGRATCSRASRGRNDG